MSTDDEESDAGSEDGDALGRAEGEAETLKRKDESSLPGLADLIGANLRGELHELGRGTILHDKWELLALLGEGSFGRVYEARHVKLGHRAAIKVLVGETAGPGARQRFLEEAQVLAGLTSEHLIRASDYDELEDGTPYFVMDLVKGKSLRHWLKERPSTWRVVEIGEQILTGLVEVHRHGVVHGDIKPENVVIGADDDKARLLDFGLARTSAEVPVGVAGTPCYMAPEMLLDGRPATVRTDVYAAGVVLYEMLTGQLPRGHLDMDATKIRQEWDVRRRADPVLMHCKQVSDAQREDLETLDKLVMEALSPDPTQRPKSALPMLEELRRQQRRLSPEAVAPTLMAESGGHSEEPDGETRATASFPALKVRRQRSRLWPAVAVTAALVGIAGWWGVRTWPLNANAEPEGSGQPLATDEPVEADDHDDPLEVEDLEAARDGILVAMPHSASKPVTFGYQVLCGSLGGKRVRAEGVLPVYCRTVPSADTRDLVALAEQAEVRIVVLVRDADEGGIVVRSTKHHRGNALLARLDGLELPEEPEAMVVAAAVLRIIVGARAAAGGTGAAEAEIPEFDWKDVGARWGVLAQWLWVQQGRKTDNDIRQRRALAQALEDELLEEHRRGVDGGTAFFRDLAVLLSAVSLSCVGSERMLRDLSDVGEHAVGVRVAALLERGSCLLLGDDASSRVEEAERVLAEAFTASGRDPCVSVAAIGSVSWIDALKGSRVGWEAHRERLPGWQRCEPGMWSRGYAVRGDTLVGLGDWCGAAEAYGLAYEALDTNINALVAWPEYAWRCSKNMDESRRELLDELKQALDSGRFQPAQRVSLAYMRWWLTRDPADAERVINEHATVLDDELAAMEGTASDLEAEICKETKSGACSLQILARPKRAGDGEALRRSLGLP